MRIVDDLDALRAVAAMERQFQESAKEKAIRELAFIRDLLVPMKAIHGLDEALEALIQMMISADVLSTDDEPGPDTPLGAGLLHMRKLLVLVVEGIDEESDVDED